uniref:hypothetical protein n=1 Tax=Poriella subacida TaxID=2872513 RepID=UPI0030015857|nr:hypothetical protein [Poriella subacida]
MKVFIQNQSRINYLLQHPIINYPLLAEGRVLEKYPNILTNYSNTVFICENSSWELLKIIFSVVGIRLSGGSHSKRHLISPIDIRIIDVIERMKKFNYDIVQEGETISDAVKEKLSLNYRDLLSAIINQSYHSHHPKRNQKLKDLQVKFFRLNKIITNQAHTNDLNEMMFYFHYRVDTNYGILGLVLKEQSIEKYNKLLLNIDKILLGITDSPIKNNNIPTGRRSIHTGRRSIHTGRRFSSNSTPLLSLTKNNFIKEIFTNLKILLNNNNKNNFQILESLLSLFFLIQNKNHNNSYISNSTVPSNNNRPNYSKYIKYILILLLFIINVGFDNILIIVQNITYIKVLSIYIIVGSLYLIYLFIDLYIFILFIKGQIKIPFYLPVFLSTWLHEKEQISKLNRYVLLWIYM